MVIALTAGPDYDPYDHVALPDLGGSLLLAGPGLAAALAPMADRRGVEL